MKNDPQPLERLLRAAASVPNESPAEMPFGFDTRVLARWRATLPGDSVALSRLLRRVILTAVALIVLGSAGAYRELNDVDTLGETLSNNDAIADSAIGDAFE